MLLLLQSDIAHTNITQGVATLALGWVLYGLSARGFTRSDIRSELNENSGTVPSDQGADRVGWAIC